MSAANAAGSTRCDGGGVVAGLVMAKWLHFAASPTFTAMALLTVVFDSDAPGVLCSAGSGVMLSGMVPMYLLMAAFHLTPWLKLLSARRNVAQDDSFPASKSF
jgi:hypothetical protein